MIFCRLPALVSEVFRHVLLRNTFAGLVGNSTGAAVCACAVTLGGAALASLLHSNCRFYFCLMVFPTYPLVLQ